MIHNTAMKVHLQSIGSQTNDGGGFSLSGRLLAACISLVILCSTSTGTCADASSQIAHGLKFLETDKPDSALVRFVRGYQEGMSKDSFYYYLARVYQAKGIPDTALAFNYSVKIDPHHPLKQPLLRQRLSIYDALGLEKLARETRDSLRYLAVRSPKLFIPGVELRANGGYQLEDRRLQLSTSSSTLSYVYVDTTLPGPVFGANARLGWEFPLWTDHTLFLGAEGGFGRPFTGDLDMALRDTLDLSGGFSAGYKWNPRRLRLDVKWMRRRTYLHDFVSSTDIALSWTGLRGLRMGFAQLAGTIDLSPNPAYDAKQVRAMGYLGRLLAPKLGLMLFATYSSSDPSHVHTVHNVTLIDFQSSLAPIPLSPNVEMDLIKATVLDTLNFYDTIPSSNLSLYASVNYQKSLPWNTRFSVGLSIALMYFPEEYRWYETRVSGGLFEVLARNPEDGELYWLEKHGKEGTPPENAFEFYSKGPFITHEHRRIDNTPTVTVSLEKRFARALSFGIITEVGKTWSTLQGKNPPVDIPNWHFRAGANLSVGIESPVVRQLR